MTTSLSSVGLEVADAAEAFSATLSASQRAQLIRERTPKTMGNWSNLPQQVLARKHRRSGVSTRSLTAPQWEALDRLLCVAMGSGYDRVRGHLAADDHLRALGGRYGYGRGEFTIAFLATPSAVGTWQLQFGGHHLAIAHTYRDGRLAGATPSFRGLEPFTAFDEDGRRWEPEKPMRTTLVDLLAAMSDKDRTRARLNKRRGDLRMGPGRDWDFPNRKAVVGVRAERLDAAGRAALLAVIGCYVDDVGAEAAAAIMMRYEAELSETFIAFCGGPRLRTVGDYVRIDGPSLWIEFSMQDGIVCKGPHPRAVWRDRRTDYGGTHF